MLLSEEIASLSPEKHAERRALLDRLAKLDPTDSQVAAQLRQESEIVQRGQKREAARYSAVAHLSNWELCHQLRKTPSDSVVLAIYRVRGGRDEFLDAVRDKKLRMGMDKFEVTCAWGDPSHVNRTVVPGGETEQLVYGDSGAYVYLTDGVMTAYQDGG